MVQARQRSDFVLIEKGLHVFKVEDFTGDLPEKSDDLKREGKNWKNFAVHCRVSGGAEDGLPLIARFARVAKDDFGLANLLQLLEVCGAIKPQTDFPSDAFDAPDFVPKMKAKLVNSLFGADIIHSKGKQKDANGNATVFANLGKLFTSKEISEVMKGKTGTAGQTAKASSEVPGQTKQSSVWD